MKKEKSETDNVYVCYCILREMHPGKHQAERLREVTEALWDAQTFYEKMGALMFVDHTFAATSLKLQS